MAHVPKYSESGSKGLRSDGGIGEGFGEFLKASEGSIHLLTYLYK